MWHITGMNMEEHDLEKRIEPVAALEEASRRSLSCDLFIVVGSSLVVYPAAHMPV